MDDYSKFAVFSLLINAIDVGGGSCPVVKSDGHLAIARPPRLNNFRAGRDYVIGIGSIRTASMVSVPAEVIVARLNRLWPQSKSRVPIALSHEASRPNRMIVELTYQKTRSVCLLSGQPCPRTTCCGWWGRRFLSRPSQGAIVY